MQARIDWMGRPLLPKTLRESLGLTSGSTADVSVCRDGLLITPQGRIAQLMRGQDDHLVACSQTVVTDDDLVALIDSGRR